MACSKDKKEFYENGKLKYECIINDSNITVCKYFSEIGSLMQEVRFDPAKNQKIKTKYYSSLKVENMVTMLHDSIISDKSYDNVGMLINDFGRNKQCIFYQYYKDKTLHCINFMHAVSNVPDYSSDSAYIFSHADQKLLLKWQMAETEKGKQEVVTRFDQAGQVQQKDILEDHQTFLDVIHQTLKKDTLQLYYEPVM